MEFAEDIVKLFSDVMSKEINRFMIKSQDMRKAFRNMAEDYAMNPRWMTDTEFKTTDYNDPAHRCAYLHKYSMLRTDLMCDILQSAFHTYSIKQNVSRKYINLCSIGGGPGTDIVALLFILYHYIGPVQCDATVMDISGEWQRTFETIISELRTATYGISAMVAKGFFNYQYMSVNLLSDNDNSALGPIGKADIITMVKFVSAAACRETRKMIQRIFQSMKLGAMVLFIDNAAGGFHEMLQEEADRCGLESVFGPMTHYNYEEPRFRRELHGSMSQFKTKVAVEMWMKPGQSLVRAQDMEVVEIDGPGRETVELNGRKSESGWRCCSIV